jgi:hypothetical protein
MPPMIEGRSGSRPPDGLDGVSDGADDSFGDELEAGC